MSIAPAVSFHVGRAAPRAAALAASILVATAASTTVEASAAEDRLCTRGDATSVLQAGIVGSEKRFDRVHPGLGIFRANAECQAELSAPDGVYTFSEDETFALQTTGFYPWRCYFSSPRDSVADFALYEERAWIAPVLTDGTVGEEREIDLEVTPVKTVVFKSDLTGLVEDPSCLHPTANQLHYRTVGAIVDLPPGEYQARWALSYDGVFLGDNTIRVVIEES